MTLEEAEQTIRDAVEAIDPTGPRGEVEAAFQKVWLLSDRVEALFRDASRRESQNFEHHWKLTHPPGKARTQPVPNTRWNPGVVRPLDEVRLFGVLEDRWKARYRKLPNRAEETMLRLQAQDLWTHLPVLE